MIPADEVSATAADPKAPRPVRPQRAPRSAHEGIRLDPVADAERVRRHIECAMKHRLASADQIPDPAGTFYRFSLPTSIMQRKRIRVES